MSILISNLRLYNCLFAYRATNILITAKKLGILDCFEGGVTCPVLIADKLNLDPKGTEMICIMLNGMGLQDVNDFKQLNSVIDLEEILSSTFLSVGSLMQIMKKGRAKNEIPSTNSSQYSVLYSKLLAKAAQLCVMLTFRIIKEIRGKALEIGLPGGYLNVQMEKQRSSGCCRSFDITEPGCLNKLTNEIDTEKDNTYSAIYLFNSVRYISGQTARGLANSLFSILEQNGWLCIADMFSDDNENNKYENMHFRLDWFTYGVDIWHSKDMLIDHFVNTGFTFIKAKRPIGLTFDLLIFKK